MNPETTDCPEQRVAEANTTDYYNISTVNVLEKETKNTNVTKVFVSPQKKRFSMLLVQR